MALSTQTVVSDGTLVSISLAFPYIDREDVNVNIDYGDGPVTYPPGVHWNWTGDQAIGFPVALADGVVVELVRRTGRERLLHEFTQGAQFNAPTLDEVLTQFLYIAQEYTEGTGGGGGGGGEPADLSAALRVPSNEAVAELPRASQRASTVVTFDRNGAIRAAPSSQFAMAIRHDQLRDLNVNGTLPYGGEGWPTTPQEEFEAMFDGGDPLNQYVHTRPTDWATCMLTPPVEGSVAHVAPNTPWMVPAGESDYRRVVPLDIRTVLPNTMNGASLFRPYETNASGVLSFEYIGEVPMVVQMRGTIPFLMRTGDVERGDATSTAYLTLRCVNPPFFDDGQSGGDRRLSTHSVGTMYGRPLATYSEFRDLLNPPQQAEIDNALTFPDLMVGIPTEHGFFDIGSTEETLLTTDSQGTVPSTVRTTGWISLDDGRDNTDHLLYVNGTGTSTTMRVQARDAEGNITYVSNSSRDGASALQFIRPPREAVAVRVNYTKRGDDAEVTSVHRLGLANSMHVDPLKGVWVERVFAVDREVVFYPGCRYYLSIDVTLRGIAGSARDTGFRYLGGGLSFDFDAGRMRKRIATNIYRR